MEVLLFAPPIVFLMFVFVFQIFSKSVEKYSRHGIRTEHESDPYACGQRDIQNYVNPDYSQFFQYAFFFTIMHVLVLVVATAPYDAPFLPVVFIISGMLSMVILFKR